MLCPRDTSALSKVVRKKPPVSEFDMLSALKPTEGCQWAHILCSAWIPEIVYTTPAMLKAAEGVSTILRDRWEEVRPVSQINSRRMLMTADVLVVQSDRRSSRLLLGLPGAIPCLLCVAVRP